MLFFLVKTTRQQFRPFSSSFRLSGPLGLGDRGSQFPVPSLGSSINYRRSLYVAGGDVARGPCRFDVSICFYKIILKKRATVWGMFMFCAYSLQPRLRLSQQMKDTWLKRGCLKTLCLPPWYKQSVKVRESLQFCGDYECGTEGSKQNLNLWSKFKRLNTGRVVVTGRWPWTLLFSAEGLLRFYDASEGHQLHSQSFEIFRILWVEQKLWKRLGEAHVVDMW